MGAPGRAARRVRSAGSSVLPRGPLDLLLQLALLAGPWRDALCPTRAATKAGRARRAAAVQRRADGLPR